ncbi:MAG: glycosyltransferase family 39 protein, partial [Sphingobacteriaceae bacterium]|nr:glycosyltransferase family 39 protein [Cytophagaceae bacterium]
MPGLSLRLFQKGFVWWPSLLTAAIVGIHHFGRQGKEGEFIDGLFYASIARNQALGQGSFWRPYFSETFWLPYADGRVFYDNPPLVFGLEALGFRLLGDHWWVERLLGTLALLSLFLLLTKTLRLLFPGSSFRHHAWLPILLTYCFYQVRWGYTNNVLETYLVLFDWGAVLWLLDPQAGRYRPSQRAGAALCLVLAFLTKGPAGLFPFVTPVLLGIFWPERLPLRRAFIEMAWLVGLWGCGVGGLLLFEAPRRYLNHFWVHQVLDAVAGRREGIMGTLTQQRGVILSWLLTEIYRPCCSPPWWGS